jgi:glycosyltransferase involved in cell wall biosynthesis
VAAVSLTTALREALADGPEIKMMRESGFERAAKHSLDALAARYLDLYDPLLTRSPR